MWRLWFACSASIVLLLKNISMYCFKAVQNIKPLFGASLGNTIPQMSMIKDYNSE